MPVKDGLEVLRWLHEHPEIPRKLPVVVLSSTELPSETQLAYAMDIQACIVKPLSYAELREKIRILKEYWLDYEARAGALKAKTPRRSSRWSAARSGRCGRGL